MPGRVDELKAFGLDLVWDLGVCTPERFMGELRSAGASQGEAYRAMVELIRDGRLKRSMFGELSVPGSPRGGSASGYSVLQKVIVIVGLLGVLAFMAFIVYMAWQRGLL